MRRMERDLEKKRSHGDHALAAAQKRIDPDREKRKGHVKWIVHQAYELPQTEEEWMSFERDVFYFGVLEGQIALSGSVDSPKPGFGKRILNRTRTVIEQTINLQPIPLGRFTKSLVWASFSERYRLSVTDETRRGNLEDVTLDALYDLILNYGHLIKQCPAPARRAKEDERCGKWFVAERPNQQYCSSRCLSRKTTRENPPEKKKRKRNRK